VRLLDLLRYAGSDTTMLQRVEVVSVDGFGVRLSPAELESDPRILLALAIDDRPLARDAGLVRLIVPSETTEALKQVKWVRTVELF
jgi:DMSO/TMAO reductase YedYZ molybdopterin-dependent catalytic subunit